jgi:hypothetical protein
MTFIERLFHCAPDGGSGSLETLYVVVAAVVVGAVVFRRRIEGWSRRLRELQR